MKKTIALLTGGTTGEWVVSVKSAATIAQNIDSDLYEVYKIMLNDKGWFYEPADSVKIEIDKNDFSLNLEGRKIKFDGVFIAIHGSPGEDGKLQGYFDMIGIPYTTCDALTSSITMNKGYTKAIVKGIDELYVAKSVQIFKNGKHNLNQIKQDLKLPYFVKPNSGGSSIGMSKVKHANDLDEAVNKAFNEDEQVLIEEFVSGREFSIGVFGADGEIVVLPTTEVIPSNEFFDFEAKYTPGSTEEITPGRMNDEEVCSGITYESMENEGVMLPLLELQSKFLKPALYNQVLTVKTIVKNLPTVRLNVDYEIYNDKQELINIGKTVLVFVDKYTRRPCHPPKNFMDGVTPHFV